MQKNCRTLNYIKIPKLYDTINENYENVIVMEYINGKKFTEIEKGWENTLEYRKKLDKEIEGERIQLKKNQGAIFMARTVEDQLTCGIHSEPPLHEPRLFLSILPGSKNEIIDTMEYYKKRGTIILKGGNFDYKTKYLKYKMKYLALKNKLT